MLFIPTYNCSTQITRVLTKLKEAELNLVDEILIIDNASQDETVSSINKVLSDPKWPICGRKVTLIKNPKNMGLGGSHKIAFDYGQSGQFEFCVILHGDDQARLADFLALLNDDELRKLDLLLGARFMPGSRRINYSQIRTIGNMTLNFLCSLLAGRKIFDLGGSGLNLFRLSSLPSGKESYLSFPDDMTFHILLLLSSLRMKRRIKFTPIQWIEEDQVSNVKVFRQGLQVLKILAVWYFGMKSLTRDKTKASDTYISSK